MKLTLSTLGILLSLNAFTQQLYQLQFHSNNPPYSISSTNQSQPFDPWTNNENYASTVASSQDSVLWSEDFANGLTGNNSSANQAWTVDGVNGSIWQYDTDGSNGTYSGSDPFTIDSETKDNGWMIFDADLSNNVPVSSYENKKGQLISPYIDLSNDSNVTLTFQHAYRYCCNLEHKLEVYIGTSSGWSSTNLSVNQEGIVNELSGTIKKDIIISDIAALEDSVRIRFDWGGGDLTASHYFWQIDDVKIIETQPYASNILTSYNRVPSSYFGGTSYRVMPLEQATETAYFFGGIAENVGFNNLDSVRIHAEISAEGYSSQSYGTSIESSSKDTMFVNAGFTPTAIGNFTATIIAKDDFENVLTDTLTQSFSVSEYIYARDNGDNVSNFGRYPINSEGSKQYGNIFDIFTNTILYSVKFRLDERTTPNAQGTVRINKVDANSGDVSYLTESGTINFGQLTEGWHDVSFDPPLILDAGQVILPTLFANYNSGVDTLFVSTSGSNPNNGESLVQDIDGIQDGVNPGDWLYTTFAPCIRLNFEPTVGIDENKIIKRFSVHPNPNRGVFNLSIQTKSTENLQLYITNILGQNIYSEYLSDVNIVNRKIDISRLEKGIYFVNLDSQNGITSTQKVIIN